jgi:DAACS family dicarboxylate/amino acid:cation (Na+ or H+) symporter
MALHNRILLGLLGGAAVGVAVNLMVGPAAGIEWLLRNVTEPLGRVWLNALIMVVIPLVISTLALGVAGLGDVSRLGRIGLTTILSFLMLTAVATLIGLVLVNTIRPGTRLDPAMRESLLATYSGQSAQVASGLSSGALSINTFVNFVPRNPVKAMADGEMLAVIVFALFIGVALTTIPREKASAMLSFLESLASITIRIIEIVMRFAPYAVFFLIFSVTARFGLGLLATLATYVFTVIGGLALFVAVGYSTILALVARRHPMDFFRKARVVMVTAFSTSSSNATLPTTLRVTEEELHVPREIAGFVIPLGATANMNGTALFEGVTVLFIAQVFGRDLTLAQQAVVVMMSIVTAIGTAGVPGGSIPLLMMVLQMVQVPVEGIAIVIGIDRILDMCRTTVNVTGDMVTATIVDRFEGARLTRRSAVSTQARNL